MTVLGSRVFLSYRRSDSGGYAGRIFSDLSAVFGADNIFKDLETLDAGVNFGQAIQQSLAAAHIILVVIGPDWTTGRSRLFEPEDWVHMEVKAALDSGKRVVPVLVGGATMPSKDEVPDDLHPLLKINAREISDSRWLRDLESLLAGLAGKDEDRAIRRLLSGHRPALDVKPFIALFVLGGLLLFQFGHLANAVPSTAAAALCALSLWQIRQRRVRGALLAWIGLIVAALYLLVLLTDATKAA